MIINIQSKDGVDIDKICPFGKQVGVYKVHVGSELCKVCEYNFENNLCKGYVDCRNVERPTDKKLELKWRKCKAGYKFPSDAIVIPQDSRTEDTDPRLVRCAVWDSIYILVADLKKLPIE